MLARRSSSEPVEMNMTPLIDVVFLLIIFFLVSSHLARQETQLDLELPDATTGEQERESSQRRVTLNLTAEGRLMLAGQETRVERLAERLQYEAAQSQGPLEVRLRADQSVPYGEVEPVLAACAKANVWNLRFAVIESRD